MSLKVGRLLDGILVVCAVATTVMLVARFARPRGTTGQPTMMRFKGWREDLAFGRRIGSATAPYRLVIWTDYQCPACKRFEIEVDRLRHQLGDSLTIVYRHFPMNNHPLAFDAAVAAECARTQGRFEAMHAALFASSLGNDALPVGQLTNAADIADTAAFAACRASPVAGDAVRLDLARGAEIGLRGTPTLQIGDRIGVGGSMAETLIPMLRSARR